jgi:hypothetical protein
MNARLQNPHLDLGVALYVLDQVEVQERGSRRCVLRERGLDYESLLLQYIEDLWIDETTGETVAPAQTLMDAIRTESERRLGMVETADSREQFQARRQLAYRRAFKVEARDPKAVVDSWNREIKLRLVNTSPWPVRWLVGPRGAAPELWFQARPEDPPAKFDCRRVDYPGLLEPGLAPGRPAALSCSRQTSVPVDVSPPDPSALAEADSWSVHPAVVVLPFSRPNSIDVAVWTPDVQERVEVVVTGKSCLERGTCGARRERSRNQGGPMLGLWPIGLVGLWFGIASFLLVRSAGGLSERRTAVTLSVLLLAGMAVASAVIYSIVSRSHDGFELLGLGLIWLGLGVAAVLALMGVWIACVVAGLGPADSEKAAEPAGRIGLFLIVLIVVGLSTVGLYSLAGHSVGSLFGIMFLWLARGLVGVAALSLLIFTIRAAIRFTRRSTD